MGSGFAKSCTMIRSFIREYLSACAKCRSLRGPIRIFCEDCWVLALEFRNTASELRQKNYPFEIYSLYTWHDEFDSVVRPLIYALKDGLIKEPWTRLAQELVFQRSLLEFDLPDWIVIPPRKRQRDHAWNWAKAISDLLLVEILDCLLPQEDSLATQKSLSILGRKERKMQLKDSDFLLSHQLERESLKGKRILFVDDTITSGATAQAAFLALGSPPCFEVWTLVARPKHGT